MFSDSDYTIPAIVFVVIVVVVVIALAATGQFNPKKAPVTEEEIFSTLSSTSSQLFGNLPSVRSEISPKIEAEMNLLDLARDKMAFIEYLNNIQIKSLLTLNNVKKAYIYTPRFGYISIMFLVETPDGKNPPETAFWKLFNDSIKNYRGYSEVLALGQEMFTVAMNNPHFSDYQIVW